MAAIKIVQGDCEIVYHSKVVFLTEVNKARFIASNWVN